MGGWPALHARLALVEASPARPALARIRRAGAVLWVSARPDPPRDLARATAGVAWLVTPGVAQEAGFLVGACAGHRVTRRVATGSGVAA